MKATQAERLIADAPAPDQARAIAKEAFNGQWKLPKLKLAN